MPRGGDAVPLLADCDMRRSTLSATMYAATKLHDNEENTRTRHRRPRPWRKACAFIVVGLFAAAALSVATAERPGLQFRQLVQPLQWAMISGYHHRGYEVVAMPPDIHRKLLALVSDASIQQPHMSYGGQGEPNENEIIFGRSARVNIPVTLQAEMRRAFKPLLSSFCGGDLDDSATIGGGGVRVYRRGASLASHLDWAHKFVISATMNVRQTGNRSRWPLHMRALGGAAHEVFHTEGEAVLYEGSRMLHSRTSPLEDDYYAAAFIGFVPKDYPAGRGLFTRLYVGLVRSVEGF